MSETRGAVWLDRGGHTVWLTRGGILSAGHFPAIEQDAE
jgi:hypothetical protein